MSTELQALTARNADEVENTPPATPDSEPSPSSDPSIPPADGGKQAWLFLTACVLVEVLVWGFSFTFGILQQAYESGPFRGQSDIAVIGTTASGVIYLSAPITFWCFEKFSSLQSYWSVTGALLMVVALISSSFATTVSQLIVTQGLLYAIGSTLLYTSSICYLDQWFSERKGFAFGIINAGTGIGGVVMPFAFNAALARYSFRTVIRAYGLIVFALLMPPLFFLRPRISARRSPSSDFTFLRSPVFWLFELGNMIQSLGFFLPPLFLPAYVADLGSSPLMGTWSVVLFNIMSVLGCVLLGALLDRRPVTDCIALSTIGSAAAVLALWGLANDVAITFAFAATYGLFAGSFSSTWSGVMRLVQQKWPAASGTMVFSYLAAGRGLGNIVSGPISEYLIREHWINRGSVIGYDSKYMPMIVFTGVSATLGGIAVTNRMRRSV